ncbi:bh protein [Alkalicoccobacillus plakortidis]|uniref:Bh protein n=1 Tax=Alkalicoccobacillus plakortidis TaxID=444060 RepID=A0ABT0XJQ3_9BACI|nr:bh protein [Alkalicoccobacillus plakortidis]MCM2676130.1 bh protein [Alkalicoccobacillus plakortidis]
MKTSQMEADLYCIHCKEEVLHEITYVNNQLKSIECLECRHDLEIVMDLNKEFYEETQKRVVTKPKRMTQEYREDLSRFLFSLPVRVISKPYRLFKDMKQSRHVIKEFDQEKDDR